MLETLLTLGGVALGMYAILLIVGCGISLAIIYKVFKEVFK